MITKNWRTKTLLTVALTLLSLYFLVPTLFPETPGGLARLFPAKVIRLGLDLRGGIYVEVEVELEDALKNRSDLISSEIKRLLEKEPFAPQAVERVPESTEIELTLKNDSDRERISSWVRENYANVLAEKRAEKTVLLDLTEKFADQTKDMAVRQALETIRHRIDRYGVAEPTIVRLGANRISVELPGMTDPERALKLIKTAGWLEFRLVDETVPDEEVRRRVAEALASLQLPEDYKAETVEAINSKLKGKIPADDEILFEAQYDPVTKRLTGGIPYLLKRKADVTGDMLKSANVDVDNNEPYVSLSFNNTGTRLFAALTAANVGKRLAIVLDGNVSKAPVIKSEIPSGNAQITLGYGDYASLHQEATDLALVLREGALPARLKELTKTVVGPSLGQDSIRRGVRVSLVAALLIIVFMALYYRLSGMMANIALLLNILLVLGALAIFQATLTLPGIAGIVLTIGMAVDANVLIFERMREELRAGRAAKNALQAGYANAMSAILDSNITTFLSGVVLYQFGTGPIRGFAVTLMIGIVTTLFTAIVVTRIFQEWVLYGLKRERLSV